MGWLCILDILANISLGNNGFGGGELNHLVITDMVHLPTRLIYWPKILRPKEHEFTDPISGEPDYFICVIKVFSTSVC